MNCEILVMSFLIFLSRGGESKLGANN